MPFVKVYTGKKFSDGSSLKNFCEEMVPAALNSEQGPLQPGSVRFIHLVQDDDPSADVFIDIEAYDFPDRENKYERAGWIKQAFVMFLEDQKRPIFTNYWKVDVCVKLVSAGFASNVEKIVSEEFFDMSINAAMKRIYSKYGYTSY